MYPPRILIVEDERALSLALAAAVKQTGADSEIAPTATIARQLLEGKLRRFSAMILDIGLPDENGLDFLTSLPQSMRLPTLVITAHGEIENTITARKLGVSDFLTKPLDFNLFKTALQRILPSPPPSPLPPPAQNPAPFIGSSPAMRPVFQQIAHACATDGPVLISGETGTGKSLVASLVLKNGHRSGRAFASFQPGAKETAHQLKDALAYTAGGILILENIENLELELQQELVKRWENDGEKFPQIVATSGSNLCKAVESGKVRTDLYYRMQVLEIRLPPLRERIADLPALFNFFLGELKPGQTLSVDDTLIECLTKHAWPGNLRELRNVASYAITVTWGRNKIDLSNLPPHLCAESAKATSAEAEKIDQALADWVSAMLDAPDENPPPCYRELADELEQMLIKELLNRYDGKLSRMASTMKANRTTLRKKLRKLP
jgi:DNA-binding NtrC family response regulator